MNVFKKSEEPKGKIIISFVARLLVDKGIREFINAASILSKKVNKAVFWIVGEIDHGNSKSVSSKEIDSWEKFPNVKFLGFQKTLRVYIENLILRVYLLIEKDCQNLWLKQQLVVEQLLPQTSPDVVMLSNLIKQGF